MLVLPRAIRSVNCRMVQAALGRSRTIHGRAYSARKKRNRVVRHKKPFDLGLPRHPEHGGRKNPCRERNQRFAEFCPKRRRRCASRQSTPRGFPREISRDRIKAREPRWVDWSFRSRAPRITPRDWRHDRTLVGERRGRLSKRISSGKVLQKSLGAGRRRRTSTSTPGRETSASSLRQSVATAHRFYIFFYA